MPYLSDKTQKNYILHMLDVVQYTGVLAQKISVNAHVYNQIPAEDIDHLAVLIKESLDLLSKKYREQHQDSKVLMEH